jgi:hypothetical protein
MAEFHTSERALVDYPMSFPNHREDGGPWMLATNVDAERLGDEMSGLVRRNPNCGTEIVVRDDEAHQSDGMLWPAAAAAEGGSGMK